MVIMLCIPLNLGSFFAGMVGHVSGLIHVMYLKRPDNSEWRVVGEYFSQSIFLVSATYTENHLFKRLGPIDAKTSLGHYLVLGRLFLLCIHVLNTADTVAS